MEYITANNNWIKAAQELYKITQLRKALEVKEKEATERLQKLSKDQNTQGGGYKYMKIERKGSIDYKSIPELQKINLELYRKDSVIIWKLEYTGLIL